MDEAQVEAVARLEAGLGWRFRRRELLDEALRHASAAFEEGAASNERLEFLGDAALSHAVALLLFTSWPDATEGELTRGRAVLVRERTLVEIGTALGVPEVLALGGGLTLPRPAVIADATEAIFGALLLDGGWSVFRSAVTRLVKPLLRTLDPGRLALEEPKSTLQEHAQRRGVALPVYHEVEVRGPAHDRLYVYDVELEGRTLARGEGRSKRAAQQEAARVALQTLGLAPLRPPGASPSTVDS